MGKENINEIKEKLIELNETISAFCPEIRSAAFDILAPYYFDKIPKTGKVKKKEGDQISETQVETEDMGLFFNSFDHKQPKNNVLLISAWLYSQYGVFPVTTKLIKAIGSDTGLVIPDRPDNTMRTAKKKGKGLFSQQGKGWKLTVTGETYLRETYGVKKGNKPFED